MTSQQGGKLQISPKQLINYVAPPLQTICTLLRMCTLNHKLVKIFALGMHRRNDDYRCRTDFTDSVASVLYARKFDQITPKIRWPAVRARPK